MRGEDIKEFIFNVQMRIKDFFKSFSFRLQHFYNFIKSFLHHSTPYISPIRTSARILLWITFFFMILFIVWAKFAVLEEVTTATATVIPLTHVQIIQNMEGGIIKEVLVREGDIVQKDQVLAYLDPTRFTSALNEARARSDALKIRIMRLTAEVNHQPIEIPKELADNPAFKSHLQEAQQLYQSHQDQLKKMQDNVDLAQQELDMTKPLIAKGAASPVEVLHLERQILDLKNQIDQFNSKLLDELTATKSDFSTLKEAMTALQDRLDRTIIRSNIKGVIKQVRIATPGSVVPPAVEIMSIVPIEDTLLIEAQVNPADIGFIHPGEPALVKITAYDYSTYGGLEGHVDKVSADTITDPKGHTYYIVRIKTDKNYLRTAANPLYIIPGMTATVSILTGKRTVLNYLISPLLKAKESALRER